MDGFGLAMFLPLLEMVSDGGTSSHGDQMGNLSFLVHGLEYLGLSLNLAVILMTMLTFFILKGIFKFFEQYYKVIYRQYFIRNIREENIKSLAKYSFNSFVMADAGRIQNTMSGEILRVGQGFNMYMQIIQQIVLLLVYAILAFLANPEFAFLIAIGGVLTNLAFNQLYKITKRLSRELTKSNHGFQGLIIQQVAQFKYLKATGLIHTYAKKLIQKVYKIEAIQRRVGTLSAIMQGVREPLMIAVVVIVIYIQVAIRGGDLGSIMLSILFFYRALGSVMAVQTSWNKYLELSGSFDNLAVFNKELKIGRDRKGNQSFQTFRDKIQLRNINFAYQDTSILKNINLEIHKDETIAFVGESGSGKTTLLNMISGLLQPQSGKLSIDGVDAFKLNMTQFQQRIGYITQEPVIFNDTIFNNVSFWAEKTPQNLERFYSALERARIDKFVLDQLDREDAILGNNGLNISGGQKQRISIARELYKKVDFLFLDEATSALDTETEKKIQDSLEDLKGEYTMIIIAHRLSTIKNVDKVIYMRDGKIEAIGSYQDLLKKSVAFKRMVELQIV